MRIGRAVRVQQIGVLFLSLFSAVACEPPLVNESYASLDAKSINGVDAFLALLEERGGKVEKRSFLTKQLRDSADLIVHFQRGEIGDESYFHRIEALLSGIDPDRAKKETKDKATTGRDVRLALEDPEVAETEGTEETKGEKEEKSDDSREEGGTPAKEYRTILYFLRDSDASLAFWTRLKSDLAASPAHTEYVESERLFRAMLRDRYPSAGFVPMGQRVIVNSAGEDRADLAGAPQVFPSGVPPFPVRSAAKGPPVFHYAHEGARTYDLLTTYRRDVLIREIRLEKGRLILVFNSESFLNHSLVRPANRLFCDSLLRYALSMADPKNLKTAFVERSFLAPEKAAKEDNSMLRMFKVFPINVIFFHFVALLALFLLSRWPHAGRPLESRISASREFTEHFRALGSKIARAKDSEGALKFLKQFLERRGRTGTRRKP